MKTKMKSLAIAIVVAISGCIFSPVSAQVTAGADVVSSYVWRGVLCSNGVNIQPTLSYVNNNFEVGAWGSVDQFGYREVDLYAGYSVGGLSLGVTDYFWTPGERYFSYKNDATPHLMEGTLGYTVSEEIPLSIAVSTVFYGDDKKADGSGDQNYSTYIELGYSWDILTAAIGMTPADGMYGDGYGGATGFAVCNMSLTAAKDIEISEKFSLPVMASLIVNPQAEDIHLVFGFSF